MSNYANLKNFIATQVYTNNNGEITAAMVKAALNKMVESLGEAGYIYKGLATSGTNPSSPDSNFFYVAVGPVTLSNFGPITVNAGEVAIIKGTGTSWTKDVTGAATAAEVSELGHEVDENKLMRLLDSQAFRLDAGGIGNTGSDGTASNRIRTNIPISTTGVGQIVAPLGFLINAIVYYSAWTDASNFTFATSVSVGARAATIDDTYPLFRIVFKNDSNTAFLPKDFLNSSHSYVPNYNIMSGINTFARLINAGKIVLKQGDFYNSGADTTAANAITFLSPITTDIDTLAVPVGYYIQYVVYYSSWTDPSTYVTLRTRSEVNARYCLNNKDLHCLYRISIKRDDAAPFTPDDFLRDIGLLSFDFVPFTPLTGGYYGAAGDSITQGMMDEYLPDNDLYRPITGMAKANYAYWIAKVNKMAGWYNYGISGTTLADINIAGHDRNGFSKSGGRYTQMADNLTHISIAFGTNDVYGPTMKKQEYATETWGGGNVIYYPENLEQYAYIGTPGWVTQEQFDTINAMTGSVGGVYYDTPAKYWLAKFIGTPNDNTNKTFWGAWNIVLEYLINKYPFAKILLVVPYAGNERIRQTIRDAAYKFGLLVYDWAKADAQLSWGYADEDTQPTGTINGDTIMEFRQSIMFDSTGHPTADGYKYIYPSINAKFLSL